MIDTDPHQTAEMRIDRMNAGLRRDFLSAFAVLDAATVHERAGHEEVSRSQTAAAWQRAGRIPGLPVQGKTQFPAFQLDVNGQPLTLLKPVLEALPADHSAWQRAFWLVAPNEWTRKIAPIVFIRRDDETVLGDLCASGFFRSLLAVLATAAGATAAAAGPRSLNYAPAWLWWEFIKRQKQCSGCV